MNPKKPRHPWRWPGGATLLALALAAVSGSAMAQGPGELIDRKAADQNRYLVHADKLVQLAPNMEPVMQHPGEIQAAIDKLAGRGFCTDVLARRCPTCKATPSKDCKKPNILIFIVDDMGWADFSAYGGGVTYGAATPNVDRLAREGLTLTSTYSQPTCSPTRATIHTGQLPIHHGVLYPPMYGDPGGLTIESLTLPWLLQQQGYYTQGVGKWHMGENEPNLPHNVGYDDYLGFLSVSDMYTEWRDPYYNPEVVRDEDRTTYMDRKKFSHYLIHDHKRGCDALSEITVPSEAKTLQGVRNRGDTGQCNPPTPNDRKVSIADLDKIWADYSVDFIHERKGTGQPWFLYHATRGCHFDNYPNEGDKRLSYARTTYSDCTVEMDEVLGRLMVALKESGQDKDTLVFFTSDNGPEDEIRPHGHTPFRGGKGDTWEGGVRVPGIAFWPGMVDAGRRSDGLFDLSDLYTTALTLAGLDYAHPEVNPALRNKADWPKWKKVIDGHYLYGIDQTSFLLAADGASNRRSVFNWFLTNFAAVRMDELKAHRVVTEPLGLKQGYFGGLAGVTLPVSYLWLFNLHADPKETENINIRHLWAQHIFSGEFGRFYCVLLNYAPNIGGIMPVRELFIQQAIADIQSKMPFACQPSSASSKPPAKPATSS